MKKLTLIILLSPLFLGACDDSTGPEGTVTLRFAHLAAGAGAFSLAVDGEVLDPALEAGEAVIRTVGLGRHTVRFEGAGTVVEIEPFYGTPSDYAVMLRDPDDPNILVRRRPTIESSVDVVVALVNMIPGSPALTISLQSGTSGATAGGLGYEDDITIGLDQGTYTVVVSETDGTESVELGTVQLTAQHAFLAVMPDPDGGLAGGFAVF